MAARAQRRACGSLPSFGETRRGIRRHGDATWRRQTGRTRRQTAPTTPMPAPRALHCRRRASCRRAAEHDVMHSLRRCRHAHRQRRPHAPHSGRRHRPAIHIALTLVNNGGQQRGHTSLRLPRRSSILDCSTISEVLDRAHQVPLAVERQCRPRTSGVENLDCDPRRQRQISQRNADLAFATATLESFEVFGMRVLNYDSSVNSVIFEQPIDDRNFASRGPEPVHGNVHGNQGPSRDAPRSGHDASALDRRRNDVGVADRAVGWRAAGECPMPHSIPLLLNATAVNFQPRTGPFFFKFGQ
jgi:hypothetical protein